MLRNHRTDAPARGRSGPDTAVAAVHGPVSGRMAARSGLLAGPAALRVRAGPRAPRAVARPPRAGRLGRAPASQSVAAVRRSAGGDAAGHAVRHDGAPAVATALHCGDERRARTGVVADVPEPAASDPGSRRGGQPAAADTARSVLHDARSGTAVPRAGRRHRPSAPAGDRAGAIWPWLERAAA